ncbi:hypothetical protein FH972_021315 [Carpinus fangiana]|uniref:Uncharacterized protein n=1 Tax=Carpinus fangiana TaxID=176857 RepID=A0A5N6KP24_9ROSI|nr:hypothetical protein FH972_021315 [Carpinus fangiana]
MSSFFTVPASQKKRKRQDNAPTPNAKKRNFTKDTAATARRSNGTDAKNSRRAQDRDDVSVSGSESEDGDARNGSGFEGSEVSDSDVDDNETEAEKRLRLAERYLENIRNEVRQQEQEVGFDAEDVDRELIAARLKEDVAEDKGRLYRYIAAGLDYATASQSLFRTNNKATTGVAVCLPYAYTVSKDMALVKWELRTPQVNSRQAPPTILSVNKTKKQKRVTIAVPPPRTQPKQLIFTKGRKQFDKDPLKQHHTAAILCVVASADGKFVVTGGMDKRMIIWDAATLKPLRVFQQHRDAVVSLAFRGKTNQLFSASRDRTIKIYHVDELAYVETLFGHQDEVVDIAAVGGSEERCVSVGARDRTARLWKVVEESQLVFRGGGGGPRKTEKWEELEVPKFAEGSLDRVIQVDTQLFVTGSDSGALSLYGLHKKKALHVYPIAHGYDPPLPVEESTAEADLSTARTQGRPNARWITALACVPFSDLFVSGSWDGCVRVWRIAGENNNTRKIEPVGVLGGGSPDQRGTLTNGNGLMESSDVNARAKIRGVINDLAVLERGERGLDGACVVAAVGDELRSGRWMSWKAKNGAVVFEIPKLDKESGVLTNGAGTNGEKISV